MRALYDGVSHSVLDAAGLTAVGAADALREYELAASATAFDDLAVLFGEDGDTWADNGDALLEDLAELFCTDGTINDAEAVGAAFADSSLPFTQEFFTTFVDDEWLTSDYTFDDADAADWALIDYICPTGVTAANVEIWLETF